MKQSWNLLQSKIISSQFGVVNPQDKLRIFQLCSTDLQGMVEDDETLHISDPSLEINTACWLHLA